MQRPARKSQVSSDPATIAAGSGSTCTARLSFSRVKSTPLAPLLLSLPPVPFRLLQIGSGGGRESLEQPPLNVPLGLRLRCSRTSPSQIACPASGISATRTTPRNTMLLDDVVRLVRSAARVAWARLLLQKPEPNPAQSMAPAVDAFPSAAFFVDDCVVPVRCCGGPSARPFHLGPEEPSFCPQIPRRRHGKPLKHTNVACSCPLNPVKVVLISGVLPRQILRVQVGFMISSP